MLQGSIRNWCGTCCHVSCIPPSVQLSAALSYRIRDSSRLLSRSKARNGGYGYVVGRSWATLTGVVHVQFRKAVCLCWLSPPASMAHGRERPGSKRRFGEQGGQASWLGGLAVASRNVEKVYRFESVLATGGQGTVRVVQNIKQTACTPARRFSSVRTMPASESVCAGYVLLLEAASPGSCCCKERRMVQEVSVHDSLGKHPQILHLIEAYESNMDVHLVFPLCPQGELGAYLARRTAITERDVRRLFLQAMQAIAKCHRHGRYQAGWSLAPLHLALEPCLWCRGGSLGCETIQPGCARQLGPRCCSQR